MTKLVFFSFISFVCFLSIFLHTELFFFYIFSCLLSTLFSCPNLIKKIITHSSSIYCFMWFNISFLPSLISSLTIPLSLPSVPVFPLYLRPRYFPFPSLLTSFHQSFHLPFTFPQIHLSFPLPSCSIDAVLFLCALPSSYLLHSHFMHVHRQRERDELAFIA